MVEEITTTAEVAEETVEGDLTATETMAVEEDVRITTRIDPVMTTIMMTRRPRCLSHVMLVNNQPMHT